MYQCCDVSIGVLDVGQDLVPTCMRGIAACDGCISLLSALS